ncbi:MAG: HAD-IA family hydrolase, partial [Acidimicrobiales bacterium]|nr:HAD-IA family hydrolase [Acidimicrobiales bacterium]
LDAISDAVVERLGELYRQRLPLLPGATEAVRALASRWPLGLASSSNRPIIDLVLSASGLADAFAVTVSSEEVSRGKPAPDVFLEAARRMGVAADRCVAIEDSSNGLRSAAAAGISVVRVKIVGFAIGSFIAGIGGTLLAYKQTNVTFQSFSVFAGLTVFSTAFLAGITSVSGGIVAGLIAAGGILFLSLDRAVDIGPWYAIASGLGVIITVIKNPEGIVGPVHEHLDRRRRARLLPAADEVAEPAGAEPAVGSSPESTTRA